MFSQADGIIILARAEKNLTKFSLVYIMIV